MRGGDTKKEREGLSLWVRQARAKSTSLLNISGIITHLMLIIIANVIALHEGY